MSRTGVSQSWMVELHAKVACIRNHPAIKQVVTSNGTEAVCAHITLAAISTIPDTINCVLVENLNFILNITAKLTAIPTRDA